MARAVESKDDGSVIHNRGGTRRGKGDVAVRLGDCSAYDGSHTAKTAENDTAPYRYCNDDGDGERRQPSPDRTE